MLSSIQFRIRCDGRQNASQGLHGSYKEPLLSELPITLIQLRDAGGEQFDAALRATKPGGRLLPLGFASGEVPMIPANIVLVKNLTILGLYWGGYARLDPKVLTESFARLFGYYSQGRLRPHISHVLPLADANQGLELLRSRKATGKVVVRI